MLIHNYKGGRLANRIIAFSHLIANSIEYKYKLYNLEFDEYRQYFEGTCDITFSNYTVSTTLYKNHFLDRAFSVLFRLWADITHRSFTQTRFYKLYRIFKSHDSHQTLFDMNDAEFVNDVLHKRVITQGWLFRDQKNVNTHQDHIRKFFTPIEKYRLEVHAIMDGLKKENTVVVGVHIRRGDYKKFAGGQWYYDDAVYAKNMMALQQNFEAQGKQTNFIICSHEYVEPSNFPEELKIVTGDRHFITDLYCLAACDAIIGPPSTFSLWASYYGKVSYAHIQNENDIVSLQAYNHLC
jgi:hypothetical protein